MARDNILLGQFDLQGIPPAPRGVPQVEVTFDIDANGIVNVSAKDKASGKEQTIRIQASGGLSDDEVESMINDAESNKEADKERREKVEAHNQGEAMINSVEQSLKEHGDKVDSTDKENIEKSIADLKSVLKDNGISTIGTKDELAMRVFLKKEHKEDFICRSEVHFLMDTINASKEIIRQQQRLSFLEHPDELFQRKYQSNHTRSSLNITDVSRLEDVFNPLSTFLEAFICPKSQTLLVHYLT